MSSILLLLLFLGIILVVDGFYRDQIEYLRNHQVVKYKFIPRNQYEDALGYLKYDMFENEHDARSAGRPDDPKKNKKKPTKKQPIRIGNS
jgi:hypothetical protein